MLFQEALVKLKEGRPLRRESWDASEGYLVILPSMEFVWKIIGMPTPNAGNFIFRVDDFTAEDWVEYVAPAPHVENVVVDVTQEQDSEAA